MNFYNEWDSYPAQWLRNLIASNQLPKGKVDDRSITDIQPTELIGYKQVHFFCGIGGWPLALQKAGWPQTLEVWTGSCPCQPFSSAGRNKGFEDDRHLWPAMFSLIRARKPFAIFGEQVASSLHWWDLVANDLESAGYTCGAIIAPAAGFGGYHYRERLYWLAYSSKVEKLWLHLPNGSQSLEKEKSQSPYTDSSFISYKFRTGKTRLLPSWVAPFSTPFPARVDQCGAIGNAIDIEQATQFVKAAMQAIGV